MCRISGFDTGSEETLDLRGVVTMPYDALGGSRAFCRHGGCVVHWTMDKDWEKFIELAGRAAQHPGDCFDWWGCSADDQNLEGWIYGSSFGQGFGICSLPTRADEAEC